MTLSDADRAAIETAIKWIDKEGHEPQEQEHIGYRRCALDGAVWPCAAVQLLDIASHLLAALSDAQAERDAAQAQVSEADIRAIEAERREAATEADAKALAEALEGYAYLDKTLTASGGNRAVDGRVAALSARERTAR